MAFHAYKLDECFNLKHYLKIPKELFIHPLYKDKLSSDSILLYGFLLDRLTLSQKNHWIDEDKNIYLIFTRQEVQDKLEFQDFLQKNQKKFEKSEWFLDQYYG